MNDVAMLHAVNSCTEIMLSFSDCFDDKELFGNHCSLIAKTITVCNKLTQYNFITLKASRL